jgi:hypothetical protein
VHLEFIGHQDHWLVYKQTAMANKYVYVSAPHLIFNCMYETQFYRNHCQSKKHCLFDEEEVILMKD